MEYGAYFPRQSVLRLKSKAESSPFIARHPNERLGSGTIPAIICKRDASLYLVGIYSANLRSLETSKAA